MRPAALALATFALLSLTVCEIAVRTYAPCEFFGRLNLSDRPARCAVGK